jgi:hypothetical protein
VAKLYRRAPSPSFGRGAFWLYRSASASADTELDRFARVEAGEDLSPQELTQNYCRYEYEPPIPELGVAVPLDHDRVRVAVENVPRDERLRRLRDVALDWAAELAKAPEDWVPFGDSSSAGLIYMGEALLHAEPAPD